VSFGTGNRKRPLWNLMNEPRTMRNSKKVLAVASGGGHWMQLMRLLPALNGYEVVFVTVSDSYRRLVPGNRFYAVRDANRWNKFLLIALAGKIAWIVCKERPDAVISTGAAPGYFAIVFGHLLGARTIWVDSIANVERLSMSGRLAGKYADLWLTQWPQLATADGPRYAGAVL
jgi:UDP-N-acetylglucosamine:LPS N-acetylglucosamine transferase